MSLGSFIGVGSPNNMDVAKQNSSVFTPSNNISNDYNSLDEQNVEAIGTKTSGMTEKERMTEIFKYILWAC